MRRLLLPLALLAAAVAMPTVASGHHVKAKTHTVKTGDDFFSPTKRTIHLRDVVKWVWVGADGKPGETINEHTIAESKGRFSSDTKTAGTFKYRFKKTGKFTILCADHPEQMKLTVTVKK
jgi:plastocyanin